PAADVASGTRLGTCAARSHAKHAAIIDLRKTAAAGADLDHVEYRDLHRKSAATLELVHTRHFELVALEGRVVTDHASLRRRAAHVERQDLRKLQVEAVPCRHEHARSGTRFEHAHRITARDLRGERASARAHDQELAAKPEPGQSVVQAVE